MKSFRRNELKRREFIELLGDAMAPCGARCRLPLRIPQFLPLLNLEHHRRSASNRSLASLMPPAWAFA